MVSHPKTTGRLNPFAFPSDTDSRFILLIVSVVGASLFIYSTVYFSVPMTRDYWLNVQLGCLQIRPETPSTVDELGTPEFRAAQLAFERCRAPAERSNALWNIGGALLLMAIAGLLYWTYPSRKIRREGLVPLSPEDAPEVVEYLDRLGRVLKLAQRPVFLWNPSNLGSSGLAFGRRGRYYVSLTGGLVMKFPDDLPAFRAVVLHELAHLRNADVDRTYFAVAVWQAFLVAALLPFFVTLFENQWVYILNITWRVAALALLVYLMRNAVLRTREMYADVRASVWDGSTTALEKVLAAMPAAKDRGWRRFLQVHPDPGKRRQILEDPGLLFPMSGWDALATGIAAAIALPNIITLTTSLLTGRGTSGFETLVAVVTVAPLVVGVVGVGTWRAAFAALQRGQAHWGAGRLGLGLGLGILLGILLSFKSAIGLPGTEAPLISESVFGVLWGIVLLASLLLFVRWIAVGASTWLEVAVKHPTPRPFYRWGLTVAGVVLAIWLGLMLVVQNQGSAILLVLLAPLGTLQYLVENPLTLVGLVCLWAFPLAARLGHGWTVPAAAAHWAYLDSPNPALRLDDRPPYRLRLAVTAGVIGGLLYCLLLLFVRFGLRLAVPEAVRNTDDYRWAFYLAQIGGAALFQVGVAGVLAIWVQRLRSYHGMLGAFVSGCVMAAGILGANLLFGGTIDLRFAWGTFTQVVNEGALLSLAVLWLVSLFGELVHPVRSRPPAVHQGQTA